MATNDNNNAFFSSHDPITIVLRNKAETIDLFGEESLIEWGCVLPEELINRYKKNYQEFWEIQKELQKYKEV